MGTVLLIIVIFPQKRLHGMVLS